MEELEKDQQLLLAGLGTGPIRGVGWDLLASRSYLDGRCKGNGANVSQ